MSNYEWEEHKRRLEENSERSANAAEEQAKAAKEYAEATKKRLIIEQKQELAARESAHAAKLAAESSQRAEAHQRDAARDAARVREIAEQEESRKEAERYYSNFIFEVNETLKAEESTRKEKVIDIYNFRESLKKGYGHETFISQDKMNFYSEVKSKVNETFKKLLQDLNIKENDFTLQVLANPEGMALELQLYKFGFINNQLAKEIREHNVNPDEFIKLQESIVNNDEIKSFKDINKENINYLKTKRLKTYEQKSKEIDSFPIEKKLLTDEWQQKLHEAKQNDIRAQGTSNTLNLMIIISVIIPFAAVIYFNYSYTTYLEGPGGLNYEFNALDTIGNFIMYGILSAIGLFFVFTFNESSIGDSKSLEIERLISEANKLPTKDDQLKKEELLYKKDISELDRLLDIAKKTTPVIQSFNKMLQEEAAKKSTIMPTISFDYKKYFPKEFYIDSNIEQTFKKFNSEHMVDRHIIECLRKNDITDCIQCLILDKDLLLNCSDNIEQIRKILSQLENAILDYSKVDWSK
ncbi:hypothetical protein [Halobacteriovorax sp.]|uniref:hypothetical protein n=1 Tax=Halobacteriovorax sp. TaxID=2020862 RepID=UPI003AF282BD